jgi:hypothetical protein
VAFWHILWLVGMFFSHFGMLLKEKSGNPGMYTRPVGIHEKNIFYRTKKVLLGCRTTYRGA